MMINLRVKMACFLKTISEPEVGLVSRKLGLQYVNELWNYKLMHNTHTHTHTKSQRKGLYITHWNKMSWKCFNQLLTEPNEVIISPSNYIFSFIILRTRSLKINISSEITYICTMSQVNYTLNTKVSESLLPSNINVETFQFSNVDIILNIAKQETRV
jgi:hypothetical protein